MKKVVLSLAIVAAMFVSCKENAAEETPAVDSTVVETPAVEEAPRIGRWVDSRRPERRTVRGPVELQAAKEERLPCLGEARPPLQQRPLACLDARRK